MKRPIIFVLVLSCQFFLSSQFFLLFPTSVGSIKCNEDLQRPDKENFISDSTNFALKLYTIATKIAPNNSQNIFISPASVLVAVGMLNIGARGTTRSQIQTVLTPTARNEAVHRAYGWLNLELNSQERKHYELYTANSIFVQKNMPVKKAFLQEMYGCFQNELQKVDFIADAESARGGINEWVEDHTNEKITNLIPRGGVDKDTRMILTNAIYFKGEWQKPFITENNASTHSSNFYPLYPSVEGRQIIQMMNMRSEFLYHQTDDVAVLGVPYKNNELAMYFFLPHGSLKEFVNKFDDGSKLSKLISLADKRDVQVSIPKFNMTLRLQLKDALKRLGMNEMFSFSADFTGITDAESLMVTEAFHKTFIEVNEKGTEAAAATAIVVATKTSFRSLSFVANHPFLFLIRHESTGAIVFMGSLNNAESDAWWKMYRLIKLIMLETIKIIEHLFWWMAPFGSGLSILRSLLDPESLLPCFDKKKSIL